MALTFPKYKVSNTGVNRDLLAKIKDVVSVTDYGADPSGLTDSTLAIEKACQALVSGQTLYFPSGTYLISYQWTPFSDSDAIDLSGRGKAVCYISNKSNISIEGNNSTIKCINHPIDVYGGFFFVLFSGSPSATVNGFTFDMSFTGYTNIATRNPFVGGIITFDKNTGTHTQDNLCSDFSAKKIKFKITHNLASQGYTNVPYNGDYYNGFKCVSIYNFGDSGALNFINQNRNLLIENITFINGSNCMGLYGQAYNNARYNNITHESMVFNVYQVYNGTTVSNSLCGAILFYQWYTTGFFVDGFNLRSLPSTSRINNLSGIAQGIACFASTTDQNQGGGYIRNGRIILDGTASSSSSSTDIGVYSSLSGILDIDNITIHSHTKNYTTGFLLGGNTWSATGASYFNINKCYTSSNVAGPNILIFSSSVISLDTRPIKNLNITNCFFNGWGSTGAVASLVNGTYYGVKNLIIDNCIFDGGNTPLIGPAINTLNLLNSIGTDTMMVTNNTIKNGITWANTGSMNNTNGLTTNNNILANLTTEAPVETMISSKFLSSSSFTQGQSVTIPCAVGEIYEYQVSHFGGGTLGFGSGFYNSTTGSLFTVASGANAVLTYKLIARKK